MKERKLTNIEKVGIRRLTESYKEVPHFTVAIDIDMSNVLELKQRLHTEIGREYHISQTVIFTRIVAVCLKQHPALNAFFQPPDIIRYQEDINIGVAVDTNRGLVVIVIKHADQGKFSDFVSRFTEVINKAKEGRLYQDDVSGGTFTISNLGMFGINWFTAIINPPQSAILSVGALVVRPIVDDDQVTIRPVLTVNLNCDHRVIDGAKAARFLADLKSMIERGKLEL